MAKAAINQSIYFLIVAVLFMAILGFAFAGTDENGNQYVDGVVVVSLKGTATQSDINDFVTKYNLSWEGNGPQIFTIPLFRAYVTFPDINSTIQRQVEMDKISAKANELFGEGYITDQTMNYVENYGGTVLSIAFSSKATHADANTLVNSINELTLQGIIDDPSPNAGQVIDVLGTVIVPEGQEQHWLEILRQDPLVSTAQLQGITYAQDQTNNTTAPPSNNVAGSNSNIINNSTLIGAIILIILIIGVSLVLINKKRK
ncbi:MAG: hypothetical protein WCI04_01165 [archaeon]